MNGLLAGPLNDAAGLDAVRADLASVVQQVLGPARVSLWIRHRDRLTGSGTWVPGRVSQSVVTVRVGPGR